MDDSQEPESVNADAVLIAYVPMLREIDRRGIGYPFEGMDLDDHEMEAAMLAYFRYEASLNRCVKLMAYKRSRWHVLGIKYELGVLCRLIEAYYLTLVEMGFSNGEWYYERTQEYRRARRQPKRPPRDLQPIKAGSLGTGSCDNLRTFGGGGQGGVIRD